MKVPVKDAEGWFKDTVSGGIECGDSSQYEKYMAGIKAEKAKEKQIDTLQNEVSGLKSELGEIKSLLLTLANKDHD
tara:strand:+ start:360 stop:587 length:228 start_codon:yes stop_codon:yes gene_type:complete